MNIIQKLGGYTAAKRIIVERPVGAVYWDRVESAYVKDLIIDKDSGYITWRYLDSNGDWSPCDSINDPIYNGDFVHLDSLRKIVPVSTPEYLTSYYKAHETAQAQLTSEQGLIKAVEAKHVRKSDRHIALWICILVVLVVFTLILRGCI